MDADHDSLGLFGVFRQQPTEQELCEAVSREEWVVGTAISALSGLDNPVYTISNNVTGSVTTKSVVTAMTWGKVEAAALACPSYQKLHALIVSGMHDDKNVWPVDLLPYYPHRHALIAAGPVLLYHDRPVIPVALRQEVLETLHGGHQGVSQMFARAST